MNCRKLKTDLTDSLRELPPSSVPKTPKVVEIVPGKFCFSDRGSIFNYVESFTAALENRVMSGKKVNSCAS